MKKNISVVGVASGIAASQGGCGDGPIVLKKSAFMNELKSNDIDLHWDAILQPDPTLGSSVFEKVLKMNKDLAVYVRNILDRGDFFTVLGGDHSCAIGTWSGVSNQKRREGDIGLLWIDAHMDSHTPATSETGNIHGMPLACLLGYGEPALTTIEGPAPKLKPEHVCLVGVRSFEPGEAELLDRLQVKVFYIDEVKRRGLAAVISDARRIITRGTVGYGITVDIDSVDPMDAPGTGVAEPNGLSATELCQVLAPFASDKRLLGMEIVEFDPHLDKNHATERLVAALIKTLAVG